MRKLISLGLSVCLLLMPLTVSAASDYKDRNLMQEMYECAQDGSPSALKYGKELEAMRNQKISSGSKYAKTSFFTDYASNGPTIVKEIEKYNARFDWYADFMAKMILYASRGDSHSMELGLIYENRRNSKINYEKLDVEKTAFFTQYKDNPAKILEEIALYNKRGGKPEPKTKYPYTEAELYKMAQIVMAEIGGASERWAHEAVAGVMVNMIDHPWRHPGIKSIGDVINYRAFFGVIQSGAYKRQTPTKYWLDLCRDTLENGTKIPKTVADFGGWPCGNSVWKVYSSAANGTDYFCHVWY